MSEASPAFQFYAKDFLSDINVASMMMEERGVYITLLCHCWLEGWLPNDPTTLGKICGSPGTWDDIWRNVKPCFVEKEGRLMHPRLEIERRKQRDWREKSARGGRKSAEVRHKKKGSIKRASTTVPTKSQPRGNSSVSGFHTPPPYNPPKGDNNGQITNDEFEILWETYPGKSVRKGSKKKAKEKITAKRFRHSFEETKRAFENYGRLSPNVRNGFIKHITTFINQGFVDQWLDRGMLGELHDFDQKVVYLCPARCDRDPGVEDVRGMYNECQICGHRRIEDGDG